jgi:hypothetical protein
MRRLFLLGLLLSTGCAGTLYTRFAGPVTASPDETYSCVQKQLRDMGYSRSQYNDNTRWYLAQKTEQNQNSSGLYRKTLQVLDTQVKSEATGTQLEITAHTYNEYANAKGNDRDEEKASGQVLADAKTLGQACGK